MLVRLAQHDRRDHGFAMAEVVVAMTLLALLLTAGTALMVRTTDVAGQNVRRTTAANLLSRQLEQARGTALADLPEGVSTSSAVVGGNRYAVSQETRYVSSADGASLCDGSTGSLLYKLVTVRVTWPDMQAVAPVRGDVLRAVGLGVDGSDAASGALALLVQDASGNAMGGITVSLRPGGASKRTDSAGCVVFVDLPPGDYAGDATSDDGMLNGSSGGRAVTAGGVAQDTITVYPPPPPPPPTTPPSAPDPNATSTAPVDPGPDPTDTGSDPPATGPDPAPATDTYTDTGPPVTTTQDPAPPVTTTTVAPIPRQAS